MSTVTHLRILKGRFILGLTGGIGSGKSEALRVMKKAGLPTCSSDELVHKCLRKGHPVYRSIVRAFGMGILTPSGDIDRPKLGAIVFSSPRKRRCLEKLVHPTVRKDLLRFSKKHRGLLVLDIPLLFESKLQKMVDRTLLIDTSEALQMQRLIRHRDLSPTAALQRIRAQLPMSVKRKRADFVIENRSSLHLFRKKVREFISELKSSLAIP